MPFMMLGGYIVGKLMHGRATKGETETELANLLAGDAILNYRTVASFANEEGIIEKYE